MAKLEFDLTSDLKEETEELLVPKRETEKKDEDMEVLRDLTSGLPSIEEAKFQKLLGEKRIYMSFSLVPESIKKEFDSLAKKNKMSKKEFFYHCLRAGGLDIPDRKIDNRKPHRI